jgi:hypothetical protein
VAATGWNDGAGIGGRPRRRRAVISGHLNERSRLAGRRIRPARPDSGDTGPTGACGFNVHKARCKRRPGGQAPTVLQSSVSVAIKNLFKCGLARGPRSGLAASCLFAELELGSRPALARCKHDPRQARPLKFSTGV